LENLSHTCLEEVSLSFNF